ncbi:MAG: hypothetical protein TR69_WS6001001314 [candidate division WS6 bacterium OLB20]|uniref:Uncharacterized protein n=1 Tax=candidate division WS6 bacterium OLB20 TaxID=1617426 RepID=A0A136LWI2_9BACT|nr:MAG: hypothetical protein TR69_WS6001001314 [candidate division WS6 bacterium OLB20]
MPSKVKVLHMQPDVPDTIDLLSRFFSWVHFMR